MRWHNIVQGRRTDGEKPKRQNKRTHLTFRGSTSGTHRQTMDPNEDEKVVGSGQDLRSLPGSIVRNWLLPGARQAACSLRKQRALICRVLFPGSALWGTPQRPSSKEDTGAEKPLVILALGLVDGGEQSEPSHPRELIPAIRCWNGASSLSSQVLDRPAEGRCSTEA